MPARSAFSELSRARRAPVKLSGSRTAPNIKCIFRRGPARVDIVSLSLPSRRKKEEKKKTRAATRRRKSLEGHQSRGSLERAGRKNRGRLKGADARVGPAGRARISVETPRLAEPFHAARHSAGPLFYIHACIMWRGRVRCGAEIGGAIYIHASIRICRAVFKGDTGDISHGSRLAGPIIAPGPGLISAGLRAVIGPGYYNIHGSEVKEEEDEDGEEEERER